MSSIPTPAYHIAHAHRHCIYDPAEDTFLLLDALERDADTIVSVMPALCVEIGCGTGVPTAFVAKLLARRGGNARCTFVCTDVNPAAAECARATLSERNGDSALGCEPVVCDLVAPFDARFQSGLIDLLLFNPPYVPTSNEAGREASDHGMIAHAWAGGSDCGIGMVLPVLRRLHKLLSPGGIMYLVALNENGIERLLNVDTENLRSSVVLDRRAGIEHLFVLKFVRVK